jgi:hypothetical protein
MHLPALFSLVIAPDQPGAHALTVAPDSGGWAFARSLNGMDHGAGENSRGATPQLPLISAQGRGAQHVAQLNLSSLSADFLGGREPRSTLPAPSEEMPNGTAAGDAPQSETRTPKGLPAGFSAILVAERDLTASPNHSRIKPEADSDAPFTPGPILAANAAASNQQLAPGGVQIPGNSNPEDQRGMDPLQAWLVIRGETVPDPTVLVGIPEPIPAETGIRMFDRGQIEPHPPISVPGREQGELLEREAGYVPVSPLHPASIGFGAEALTPPVESGTAMQPRPDVLPDIRERALSARISGASDHHVGVSEQNGQQTASTVQEIPIPETWTGRGSEADFGQELLGPDVSRQFLEAVEGGAFGLETSTATAAGSGVQEPGMRLPEKGVRAARSLGIAPKRTGLAEGWPLRADFSALRPPHVPAAGLPEAGREQAPAQPTRGNGRVNRLPFGELLPPENPTARQPLGAFRQSNESGGANVPGVDGLSRAPIGPIPPWQGKEGLKSNANSGRARVLGAEVVAVSVPGLDARAVTSALEQAQLSSGVPVAPRGELPETTSQGNSTGLPPTPTEFRRSHGGLGFVEAAILPPLTPVPQTNPTANRAVSPQSRETGAQETTPPNLGVSAALVEDAVAKTMGVVSAPQTTAPAMGGSSLIPAALPAVPASPQPNPDQLVEPPHGQDAITQASFGNSLSGHDPTFAGSGSVVSDQVAPRQIVSQVVGSIRLTPDLPVELTLQPEELGRVQIVMRHEGASLAVTLTAERPEILDLLRRNIDLLAQEMRAAGYSELSFSFGQNGGERPERPGTLQSEEPSGNDSSGRLEQTAVATAPLPVPARTGEGMDIRI